MPRQPLSAEGRGTRGLHDPEPSADDEQRPGPRRRRRRWAGPGERRGSDDVGRATSARMSNRGGWPFDSTPPGTVGLVVEPTYGGENRRRARQPSLRHLSDPLRIPRWQHHIGASWQTPVDNGRPDRPRRAEAHPRHSALGRAECRGHRTNGWGCGHSHRGHAGTAADQARSGSSTEAGHGGHGQEGRWAVCSLAHPQSRSGMDQSAAASGPPGGGDSLLRGPAARRPSI